MDRDLQQRLNEAERRVWRPATEPPEIGDILSAQAAENARLIQLNKELDAQERSLVQLEESVNSLHKAPLWRALVRVARLFAPGSARVPTAPEPVPQPEPEQASPYQLWCLQNESAPILPAAAANLPVTTIVWCDSEDLIASLPAQPRLVATDLSTLEQQLLKPYDGIVLLVSGEGRVHPDTIAILRQYAAAHPDTDVFYADEDLLEPSGVRSNPFFKPDWSPDLLLAMNYFGGLIAFRPAFGRQVTAPTSMHDVALQLTRLTQRIVHIPRVLFHSRPASQLRTSARVRYPVPTSDAKVSIIIPTAGRLDVLRANLHALFHRTAYQNFDVLLIDNSDGDDVAHLAAAFDRVRLVDCRRQPFHYSRLNNNAARETDAPFLLFLNDDTEALAPAWLEAMLELAAREEVGAVGAKLLYPDGRIQHAGIVMGLFDNCGHAFRTLTGDAPHYFGLSDAIRNVSAVTAACLMTRAEVFWEVGGFDEAHFPVAYNDVDLCLRIGQAGFRVLYTPHAVLRHYEAYSKPEELQEAHAAEREALQRKWGAVIRQDPFYSPNLTRWREDFALQEPNAQAPMPR